MHLWNLHPEGPSKHQLNAWGSGPRNCSAGLQGIDDYLVLARGKPYTPVPPK